MMPTFCITSLPVITPRIARISLSNAEASSLRGANVCAGPRRVVAVVLRSSTARAILEHLRLPSRPLPLAPATSPPPPPRPAPPPAHAHLLVSPPPTPTPDLPGH